MISIIVPIYNAEKYIFDCVKSIEKQNISDYEIILIDDGSKDGSAKICKQLAKENNRIQYIYQKNVGVSSARNKGIEVAKGEYIVFVDSDDELIYGALTKMVHLIKEKDADLVIAGFEVEEGALRTHNNDNDNIRHIIENESNDGCIGTEVTLKHSITIEPQNMLCGYIWRNIFKTSIIIEYGIQFDASIKISEDFKFIIEYIMHCSRIALLSEPVYIYKINPNSTTRKYMNTIHLDMRNINSWIEQNVFEKYPDARHGFESRVANTYLLCVQNLCRKGTPYSLINRIKYAYHEKRKYNYTPSIQTACKQNNRKKAQIAFRLFKYNMEWFYIILFSLKQRL